MHLSVWEILSTTKLRPLWRLFCLSPDQGVAFPLILVLKGQRETGCSRLTWVLSICYFRTTPAVSVGQVRRRSRQEARARSSGCFLEDRQPDGFKRKATPNLETIEMSIKR